MPATTPVTEQQHPTELELVAGTAVRFENLELAKRFELFDRARNRRRFYTLRLARDRQLGLYGKGCGSPDIGWILIVSRGRIGGKPIEREERFLAMDRAIERYGHLCTERRSHGYTEVSC